jgi:ornithine cyclodeaminase/alanine dehydrogenase-like protein (mu-crystallin family)
MPVQAPPVLLLSKPEVESLLPMEECIETVESAFATLARGGSVQPLRSANWLPDRSGLLGTMPGMAGSSGEEPATLGIKVVTVFPGNHPGPGGSEPAFPSHQGVVLVFDARRGNLTAILDAESITAIRTAAASAVATRWLAREDASTLALLGSGVQAKSHLEAMRAVRPIERVRVWSRTPEHARTFAEGAAEEGADSAHGLVVEAVDSARRAVEGADLVCTVTGSSEPVLEGSWLGPGTHVNAVGACTPQARELDTEVVARSRLYTDRRESLLVEAGDFRIPKAEGAVTDEHLVGELGDLILGRIPGRRSDAEITLFKSLGIAVEDLATADLVVRKAREAGIGREMVLG